MISKFKKNDVNTKNNDREIELRGLSTDTKPTEVDGKDVPNGTVFVEIDTGKIYFYDLENQLWKEA